LISEELGVYASHFGSIESFKQKPLGGSSISHESIEQASRYWMGTEWKVPPGDEPKLEGKKLDQLEIRVKGKDWSKSQVANAKGDGNCYWRAIINGILFIVLNKKKLVSNMFNDEIFSASIKKIEDQFNDVKTKGGYKFPGSGCVKLSVVFALKYILTLLITIEPFKSEWFFSETASHSSYENFIENEQEKVDKIKEPKNFSELIQYNKKIFNLWIDPTLAVGYRGQKRDKSATDGSVHLYLSPLKQFWGSSDWNVPISKIFGLGTIPYISLAYFKKDDLDKIDVFKIPKVIGSGLITQETPASFGMDPWFNFKNDESRKNTIILVHMGGHYINIHAIKNNE